MYTPGKRVMYIGGGWGDAIYFTDYTKTRIYGFKGRGKTFTNGSVLFDLVNNVDNDSIPLYYISNVEWINDPSDMFFADISLIGNVRNPKVGRNERYEEDWYKKDVLPELITQFEEEINNTNFFKFARIAKLRKYINILKEMLNAKPYVYQGFV